MRSLSKLNRLAWSQSLMKKEFKPCKNINLFMIDLNGEALVAFQQELESKYKNVKVVTKQLDLTSLMNQSAFDELDQELK